MCLDDVAAMVNKKTPTQIWYSLTYRVEFSACRAWLPVTRSTFPPRWRLRVRSPLALACELNNQLCTLS